MKPWRYVYNSKGFYLYQSGNPNAMAKILSINTPTKAQQKEIADMVVKAVNEYKKSKND